MTRDARGLATGTYDELHPDAMGKKEKSVVKAKE